MTPTLHARRLLTFIVTMERQDQSWCIRSAAHHLGLYSSSGVHRLLKQLCERGCLTTLGEGYKSYRSTAHGRDLIAPITGFRFVPAPHQNVIGRAAC